MKRFAFWLLAASLPLLLHAPPALSAVDLFLKIDGIDGESTVKGREKWIEVLSYSWGVTNNGSFVGGGGGAGKASFQDFNFTKYVDVSSPKLFQHAASGEHIKSAILEVVTAGEKPSPFLTYTFTDLLVTSFSQSSGGDIPVDSFSFAFAKLAMDYRPLKADGTLGSPIHGSWDIKQNVPAPEPSTWAMLIAGLAFVAWRGRRMAQARLG